MSLCSPWITESDLAACDCPTGDAGPTVVEANIATASEIMYSLTGSQWPGECEETIYPMPCRSGSYCGTMGSLVFMDFGSPWPGVSTRCLATNGCDCCSVSAVRFDRDRILEVSEVRIGTEVVGSGAYRLDVDRRGYALVRIDGGHWPCWNDVAQTLPGPDAWSVTYAYGSLPPADVVGATARLATELVKACIGDATCRLPHEAVSAVVEGVSFELPNAQSFISEGRTGLWEVDLVIKAVNPGNIRRRGRIVSPESVENRRVAEVGGS